MNSKFSTNDLIDNQCIAHLLYYGIILGLFNVSPLILILKNRKWKTLHLQQI